MSSSFYKGVCTPTSTHHHYDIMLWVRVVIELFNVWYCSLILHNLKQAGVYNLLLFLCLNKHDAQTLNYSLTADYYEHAMDIGLHTTTKNLNGGGRN